MCGIKVGDRILFRNNSNEIVILSVDSNAGIFTFKSINHPSIKYGYIDTLINIIALDLGSFTNRVVDKLEPIHDIGDFKFV